MSMVRMIVGGVDTHVAAVIDANGGVLGVESLPADHGGFEALLGWLASHGEVDRVGVEGTGSWSVGLARFLHDQEILVVEVDRPNRQDRWKVVNRLGILGGSRVWKDESHNKRDNTRKADDSSVKHSGLSPLNPIPTRRR